MSHVGNMVLVVLGVTSSLKCLVLYLHVVEERLVASLPGSSLTNRNGMEWKKIATTDCYNTMGPCDVDKPQNLTLGN